MEKSEAIVDTCFLQKVSDGGIIPDNIKTILDELNFIPVAHPYICDHEFSLHSYSKKLIDDGYIRRIDYCEFLKDECDKQLYEGYFFSLHEEMRLFLEAKGGPKQIKKLSFNSEQNIYNTHYQGSSMGDVHMVLMAAFMNLPIILTEDSDIELLSVLAKKRISIGDYNLVIYNAWDLIKRIADSENPQINKKDLVKILNNIGERNKRSELNAIWNSRHSN